MFLMEKKVTYGLVDQAFSTLWFYELPVFHEKRDEIHSTKTLPTMVNSKHVGTLGVMIVSKPND